MTDTVETDICVLGAGSGGLTLAAGAVQMGARVVLVEKGRMGGDCLNTGCVPSKSLIAAAQAANTIRGAGRFGVNGAEPEVDFARVHAHVHEVIAAIAPNDSVERFRGLGVEVIEAPGRFTGPREVRAGDHTIRARRFVVATGSSPAVPPIEGLGDVSYLTNETVFDLTERPDHLIVIGGGPIGAELAQAHRRLGARVTVLEMLTLMSRDDPEAVDFARRGLLRDGVDLREGVRLKRVEKAGNAIAVVLDDDGEETRIQGSHLLVAAGRRANVEGLGLEAAGVSYSPKGIAVDRRLRTSRKHIYAIGDVTGAWQFTHVSNYHAGIVLRNVLFRLPARVDERAIPWVTYTDPEVAQVGLGEMAAREQHGDGIRVLRWSFAENDRAQAERTPEGMIKVVTDRRGRILGATLAGPHAGELVQPWVLAIGRGLRIGAMAGMIVPYPTLAEVSKRAAGAFYMDKLFSDRTRKLVRFLLRLG